VRTFLFPFAGVLAGCALAAFAVAQSPPATDRFHTAAAFVDEEPVMVAEVDYLVRRAIAGREVTPESMPLLQAQSLNQLIGQRLALQQIAREHLSASESQIESRVEEIRKQLEAQKVGFESRLAEMGLDEPLFRQQLAWELGWARYLDVHRTGEAVSAYFEAHRREFDGSEVEVSHILLRVDRSGDAAAANRALQEAQRILNEIVAGRTTFEEAAREYSDGPSRLHGGTLGFIPRHGRMVEAFSRAAFALEVDQISQPVLTSFGIHLIRVTSVKPGDKTLDDVRAEVEAAVGQKLLDDLTHQAQATASIRYTGAIAYFDPATRTLVQPSAAE